MSFPTLAACLASLLVLLAGFAAAVSADEPARERSTEAPKPTNPAPPQEVTEKATFGGGCFWCLEAVFERIPGVKSVVPGYAGGRVPNPSYQLVCTGQTGHAEVVQIVYDPRVVSFEQLLNIFWRSHDPTTLNRQGPDIGTQYRSIVLYHNEAQRQVVSESMSDLMSNDVPVVTELVPLLVFYPAEAYHRNYYDLHRSAPYCQMVIAPKLRKLHLDSKPLNPSRQDAPLVSP